MEAEFMRTWDDFCCEHSVRKRCWRMKKMHYHGSYELFVVTSGETELFIEDHTVKVKRGDIAFFNKNVLHRNNGGTQHGRYALNFSDRFLEKHFKDADIKELLRCFGHEKLSVPDENMGYVKRILERMTHPGGEFAYLAAFLTMISDISERDGLKTEKIETAKSRIEPIFEFINSNYAEIETVGDIADAVHMSKSYLCQKFKRETTMTITEYLNSVRIRNACAMLTNGMGVSETSLRCGYSTPSYFCRIFKNIVHMTPSEYRRYDVELRKI